MMNKMTGIKGYHILADLWGCPPDEVNEANRLEEILIDTTNKVGFKGVSLTACPPSGLLQIQKNFTSMGLSAT